MLIDNITFFSLYNLIYFCTACLAMVSALSSEIKKDFLLQNKLGSYLALFPLIFLILLTGFREYNVGTDTGSYYRALWLNSPEINLGSEFLFSLIALILRYFGLDYNYFLLLISFLFYFIVYKSLKNYTDLYKSNLLITFFSCISLFFFLNMSINIIRQGVSLSFLLFAYSLWINKKNNIAILFVLFLSLAFHLTSIIPILLFILSFFMGKFKSFNILIFVYCLSILISYLNYGFLNFSPIFLEFLGGDRRVQYFNEDDYDYNIGFKPQFAAFNTFFLLISIFVKSRLSDPYLVKQYNILIYYYVISSIILFMAFQLPFSDRWGLFSWFIIPLLISPLFYSPFIKVGIKIHFIVMLFLIYIGFNYYVQ